MHPIRSPWSKAGLKQQNNRKHTYTWKLNNYLLNDNGHHWKERPIGHTNFICPSTGERQGQKNGNEWVGKWGGEVMGDFWDSIGNVIEENM